MLGVLGRTYRSLGAYDRAEALLHEAVETARAPYGPEHPEVAVALNALANLTMNLGRPAHAEALYREALATLRATLPAGHSMTSAVEADSERCAE